MWSCDILIYSLCLIQISCLFLWLVVKRNMNICPFLTSNRKHHGEWYSDSNLSEHFQFRNNTRIRFKQRQIFDRIIMENSWLHWLNRIYKASFCSCSANTCSARIYDESFVIILIGGLFAPGISMAWKHLTHWMHFHFLVCYRSS